MKTVFVGPWDGEQVQIQVEDAATIGQVLSAAGLRLANSQTITTLSSATDLSINDGVVDGETYVLTGNQVSGQ
jgi:hypothetical protein